VTASVPRPSSQQAGTPGEKKSFPRPARLLRHADFERVYKQGRRHFSPSMTVFYLQRQQLENATPAGLRIGFTVSRALGGAVDRNRMRRRMREAVRLSPTCAANADVVINPKKIVLKADFSTLLNEVGRAFVVIEEKLQKLGNKSSEAAN
jgi:ribonuclease P protein component